MKKRILIHLILTIPLILKGLSLSASAFTADTLKVMQYNILNYGNNTSYCTASNNNINDKNGYIRTILTAYYPDIFTVCEMGRNTSLPGDFVRNVLNVNGVDYWLTSAGSNTTTPTSSLINCIFYNSEKLSLTGHYVAQNNTRDVDVYDFKMKSDNSITLTCVIAHLKAGSGSDNAAKRKIMAENTMNYLESHYQGRNVLIMGDFNLYSASEAAYQAFTNESAYPNSYFIDPLYPYGVGDWNSNYNYRYYHTQSTHTEGGCASSGGLDDRFDFILMSECIYGGRDGIRYVNGSYNAIGNDGNHYNKSINNPANQAVSAEVADALYGNSDHLPVTMNLVLGHYDVNELNSNELSFDIFPNPTSEKINIRFYQNDFGQANLLLFNTLGQTVYSADVFVNDGLSEHVIPVENLQKGLYFLRISNADGLMQTIKIVVE